MTLGTHTVTTNKTKAAETIKAACPTGEPPHTPPGRLNAAGKRLQTLLQAVETVQPGAAGFLQVARRRPKGALQQYGPATFCCRAVN
jgi:hypothetical protein